jgi:uncharacterized membrane protein YbhN (UPF0104 family)
MLLWMMTGGLIFCMMKFHGFGLPVEAAFVTLVIIVIGISIPTAPGMLGNFQYAAIVALTLYGLPKDPAFMFSITYYLMSVGMIIFYGLVFLPTLNIDIMQTIRKLKGLRSEAGTK